MSDGIPPEGAAAASITELADRLAAAVAARDSADIVESVKLIGVVLRANPAKVEEFLARDGRRSVVEGISNEKDSVNTDALEMLMQAAGSLTSRVPENCPLMRELGLMESLVSIIRKHTETGSKCLLFACSVATVMCAADEGSSAALVAAGGVEVLSVLTSKPGLTLMEKGAAANLIANIIKDATVAQTFYQAGIMTWILGLLENHIDMESMAEVAFMVIHNVLLLCRESGSAFVAGNGIEALCNAFRAHMDNQGCAQLASAVMSDFTQLPEIGDRCMFARAPQLLVTALGRHKDDPIIVTRLMAALNNLTYNNMTMRAAFVEAGGIAAAVSAAAPHTKSDMVMGMAFHGLGVLINDKSLRGALKEANFMELCVAMLNSPVEIARIFAVQSAAAMITSEPSSIAPFLLADGGPAAAKILKELKDDKERVHYGLGLTTRMTNWQGGCARLHENGSVPVLVEILATHKDKHVPATLAMATALNLVASDVMATPLTFTITKDLIAAGFMPACAEALRIHGEQDTEISSYAAHLIAHYAPCEGAKRLLHDNRIPTLLLRLASRHSESVSLVKDTVVALNTIMEGTPDEATDALLDEVFSAGALMAGEGLLTKHAGNGVICAAIIKMVANTLRFPGATSAAFERRLLPSITAAMASHTSSQAVTSAGIACLSRLATAEGHDAELLDLCKAVMVGLSTVSDVDQVRAALNSMHTIAKRSSSAAERFGADGFVTHIAAAIAAHGASDALVAQYGSLLMLDIVGNHPDSKATFVSAGGAAVLPGFVETHNDTEAKGAVQSLIEVLSTAN